MRHGLRGTTALDIIWLESVVLGRQENLWCLLLTQNSKNKHGEVNYFDTRQGVESKHKIKPCHPSNHLKTFFLIERGVERLIMNK